MGLEDADESLIGQVAGEFGIDPEELTVDSHFKIVGAFDMPGWRFDSVKGAFGLYVIVQLFFWCGMDWTDGDDCGGNDDADDADQAIPSTGSRWTCYFSVTVPA